MHQATAVSAADTKTIIYLCIKRLVDIVGGLVGLIILLPIALIIKIVSMCNGDFDKIIFVQKRIGKNGQEFDKDKIVNIVLESESFNAFNKALKYMAANPTTALGATLVAAATGIALNAISNKGAYKSGQIDQKYTDRAAIQKSPV